MEGECGFIKDYISGDVNSAGRNMETTVSFMLEAVSKENTELRPKGKFVLVIWSEVGPTGTAEDFQEIVVWSFVKEEFERGFVVGDR